MVEVSELQVAVLDALDPDEAYHVLADHLIQLGDPRGELIALELAGQDTTQFFERWRPRLLGPLGGVESERLDLTWHRGFVSEIALSIPGSSSSDEARLLVRRVLTAPAASLARRVQIVIEGEDAVPALDGTVLRALTTGAMPSVAELKIHALSGLVSSSRIAEAFPRLRVLDMQCRRISFGGVRTWKLATLRLMCADLPVASFAACDWPELRRMSLTVSLDGDLTDLLRAVPALESLRISATPKLEIVRSLLESGRAGGLVELEIFGAPQRELDAAGGAGLSIAEAGWWSLGRHVNESATPPVRLTGAHPRWILGLG